MDKTIVLFDMDGTLTESRKVFNCKELAEALYRLTNCGVHIGIITGSDEDYLREQMGDFLRKSSGRYKTHLLPCNGTKYYTPPSFPQEDFKLKYEVSMENHLGKKNYKILMQELIYSQVDMANSEVPLTGHFINCRGSMINWCPIGRNATHEDREEFMLLDKTEDLRERVLLELRAILKIREIDNLVTVKLGGDTSFDIYPTGWDKTYGLQYFKNWDVWFVGDRCQENGNDREIYESCFPQSYQTSGPIETVEIIKKIKERL